MKSGKIIEEGNADEVFNNPIRRAMGGMVRSGIGAMAREVM